MTTLDVRALLELIARHPVLPPPGEVPPDSEELRAILSEVVRGPRSAHAPLMRAVAAGHGLAFDELARRAGFVLACLALPAGGTHYERLGVSPTASSREIRKRWAALILRHHPDRAGPKGVQDDQAHRLIEAYRTLRDPDRRRRYDAELARERGNWLVPVPVEASGRGRRLAPPGRPRWAPAAIVVVGALVVVVRWTSPLSTPTPRPVPRIAPPRVAETPPGERPASPERRRAQKPAVTASSRKRAAAAPPPRAMRERRSDQSPGAPATTGRPDPLVDGAPREPLAVLDTTAQTRDPLARDGATERGAAAALGSRPDGDPLAPDGTADRRAAAALGSRPDGDPMEALRSRPDGDPDNWRALIEAFRRAYERKDLDALMSLLGAAPREQGTTGREAIEQLYATNFRVLDGIRYALWRVTARPTTKDGDIVVDARFRIRATRTDDGARPLDARGAVRWAIRREGAWLRIVEIDYEMHGR